MQVQFKSVLEERLVEGNNSYSDSLSMPLSSTIGNRKVLSLISLLEFFLVRT